LRFCVMTIDNLSSDAWLITCPRCQHVCMCVCALIVFISVYNLSQYALRGTWLDWGSLTSRQVCLFSYPWAMLRGREWPPWRVCQPRRVVDCCSFSTFPGYHWLILCVLIKVNILILVCIVTSFVCWM
jgi:hypothetical protein